MSIPLIECRQLACERDNRVLFSRLDLRVAPGDMLQIEGPNGCGKTTLLRALATLLGDYQGEILWQGHPIAQDRLAYLNHLLFIGHLPGVKKSLSPRENLHFLMNLQAGVDADVIDQALGEIGLYGYEDMPGYHLSAGQLRRVSLARLYLSQAPIWLLDEPYTAIDKQGVAQLEALFTRHTAAGGCIILTSHQTPAIDHLRSIALQDYTPQPLERQGGL